MNVEKSSFQENTKPGTFRPGHFPSVGLTAKNGEAKRSRRIDWNFLAAAGLLLLFLFPILDTGYISDDILHSVLRGRIALDQSSVSDTILNAIILLWDYQGRVAVLNPVLFTLIFAVFPSLILYKLYLVAMILWNVTLLRKFLLQLGTSLEFAALACASLVLFFQFRAYHDCMTTFYGLLQLTLSFTLLSLIYLRQYLTAANRKYYLWSILFYFAALQSYEISFLFFVLHILLLACVTKSVSLTIRKASPYLALVLLHGILVLVARNNPLVIPRGLDSAFNAAGDPYHVNTDISVYLVTLAKQLSATFPLNYFLNDPSGIFSSGWRIFLEGNLWPDYFLLAASFLSMLALTLSAARSQAPQAGTVPILLFGLSLFVLPALIMSSSPKFQNELKWGLGYLPVYVQAFGLTLLSTAGVMFLLLRTGNRGRRTLIPVMLAAILASVCYLNYRANRVGVHRLNELFLYPRIQEEAALQAGLLSGVPENSTLRANSHAWEGTPFFYMHTGKQFEVVRQWKESYLLRHSKEANVGDNFLLHDAYELRDVSLVAGKETIKSTILTKAVALQSNGAGNAMIAAGREWRIFLRSTGNTLNKTRLIVRATTYADRREMLAPVRALTTLREGKDWALLQWIPSERVSSDSVRLASAEKPTEIYWGEGFSEQERSPDYSWRWCDKRGAINVMNTTKEEQFITLRMLVASGVAEVSDLNIVAPGLSKSLKISATPVPLAIPLVIAAGDMAKVLFTSTAKRFESPGDPRSLYFRVDNFDLTVGKQAPAGN